MINLATLESAAALVRQIVPPTPQYCWPLLSRRLGTEVWVKHENHTPIGAFKIRGGLVYLDDVKRSHPDLHGVVSATTGNHGQSVALAAGAVWTSASPTTANKIFEMFFMSIPRLPTKLLTRGRLRRTGLAQ